MICSVLIPSRKRINQLFAAIFTLHQSGNPKNFEIILRLDDDDRETLEYLATLRGFGNVRTIIGNRGQGWSGVEGMWTDMAKEAQGTWCWFLTDDCVIGGRDFDRKFEQVPTKGFIVQPEISRLGGSTYPKWEGSNFPAVPNGCWRDYGWNRIERPLDTGIDDLLRIKNGWKTWFLEGICAWHLEDTPAKLEEHRK